MAIVFYGFAGMAIVFSLMVILLRNPVTSALSLVVSFFAVSAIFVLLHAPFLGVIQILIYTGAILVLFLYVTMLLNLRGGGANVNYDRITKFGAILLLPLLVLLLVKTITFPDRELPEIPETFGSMASVGEALLGPYALLFEMASVLLLAAIVGAVVLAVREKGKAA